MSELANNQKTTSSRLQFLVSVSALALAGAMAQAQAEDASRPTVWIELGAQASHIDGTGERFAPAFTQMSPTPDVFTPVSPIDAQRPPRFGIGGEGRILVMPQNSDWVLSASVSYGRSNGAKRVQRQDGPIYVQKFFRTPVVPSSVAYTSTFPAVLRNFAETRAANRESHLIVDFMAGKDIGIGMFGRDGSSAVSLGVRFAQFTSRASVDMKARPDLSFFNQIELFAPSLAAYFYLPAARFHAYTAFGTASRSFHGIGPAISWEGSRAIAGNTDAAELTFDWGLNAALLFGRQKAQVGHQTTTRNFPSFSYITTTQHGGHVSSRSVTVPNVGGFAGLSVKFSNSKISFGYRGDIFFGAMDTGIDARHAENISFHGPFAKISIGVGG